MTLKTTPTVIVNGLSIQGLFTPASDAYPRDLDLFYGIPYAGTNRFQPAHLLPLDRSIADQPGGSHRDASRYDPFSAGASPCAPLRGERQRWESHLELHIVRPAGTGTGGGGDDGGGKLIPVVVYIHGGGFNSSGPLERNHRAFVAWNDADVLVVAVQYRLGPMGFMAGGGLRGDADGELNLGLKDQRVAIGWVNRWIHAFGGDKDNVSLIGVSAGAHSIGHHLLNPSAVPFRKAIIESGSPTARMVLSATHPRVVRQYKDLKERLPRNHTPSSAPSEDLSRAGARVFGKYVDDVCWPWQPVVERHSGAVPDLPITLWNTYRKRLASPSDNTAAPAVITGFCSNEGYTFSPRHRSFRAFFANLIPAFSPSDLDTLEALYPDPETDPDSPYRHDGPEGPQWRRIGEAYGHFGYICPAIHTAHELSAAGSDRVYLYEYACPNNPAYGGIVGHACHGQAACHDPALFDPLRDGLDGTRAMVKELYSRWAAFSASDDDGRLPEDVWPSFRTPFAPGGGERGAGPQPGEGKLLIFGAGNDEAGGGSNRGVPVATRTLTARETEVCRFWWDRMELSEGVGKRGVTWKTW